MRQIYRFPILELDWLKEEVKGYGIPKFIFLCIFLILTFNFVTERIINILNYKIPDSGTRIPVVSALSRYILNGPKEEVIWRLVPLGLGTTILGRSKYILIIAMISSIWFGIMHGNIFNIFIQGIGGFILCIMFLKCGGFQKKYTKAFLTTSTTHILLNIILFGIRLTKEITVYII